MTPTLEALIADIDIAIVEENVPARIDACQSAVLDWMARQTLVRRDVIRWRDAGANELVVDLSRRLAANSVEMAQLFERSRGLPAEDVFSIFRQSSATRQWIDIIREQIDHWGRTTSARARSREIDDSLSCGEQNAKTLIQESSKILCSTLFVEGLVGSDGCETAGCCLDHVIAVMKILGIRFALRIPRIEENKLHIPQQTSADALTALAPAISAEKIDEAAIQKEWDEILRVAVSIRKGTVPASIILQGIASRPKYKALSTALRELGRMERTVYTLAVIGDPDIRRLLAQGLKTGNEVHAYARTVVFPDDAPVRPASSNTYLEQKSKETRLEQLEAFRSSLGHAIIEKTSTGSAVDAGMTARAVMGEFVRDNMELPAWSSIKARQEVKQNVERLHQLTKAALKHLNLAQMGGPAIEAEIMCDMLRIFTAAECQCAHYAEQLKRWGSIAMPKAAQGDVEEIRRLLHLISKDIATLLTVVGRYLAESLLSTKPQSFGISS